MKYHIQVFARAPIAGFCKTRLAKELGIKQATAFHAEMVDDTLSRLTPGNNVQLWCKPDKQHAFFQKMCEKYPVITFNQQGDSLGVIMDNAAKSAFMNDASAVIQVGTDCPLLDQQYINQAEHALDEVDIVIGPAADGGYVLLAQKNYHKDLYRGITWGSSAVLQQLIENVKRQQLSFMLLETLFDIDTVDDMKRLNDNRFPVYEGKKSIG